ncbi:MAG: hypothetical protein IPJ55_17640 [Chloracidobacterium sp.]|nr:hypothetical protein [Chloracidobacterium sp.]
MADSLAPAVQGGQFNIQVDPAIAATVSATAGTPQSATIGTPFATALQATVKDAFNNPVAGATVTFTAPAAGASGVFTLTGTDTQTATTNAAGVATASTFTANGTTGGYSVTASVPGASSGTFNLANTAGLPASTPSPRAPASRRRSTRPSERRSRPWCGMPATTRWPVSR